MDARPVSEELLPQPGPEPPVEALRDEICRAAVATDEARSLLQIATGSALVGLGFLIGLIFPMSVATVPEARVYLILLSPFILLTFALPFWVLGNWCALPLPAAYRWLRREQFRAQLARLSREELAQVLLSLEHEPLDDVRKIVAPLIEEFRPQGGELAPALAPTGAGRELLPHTGSPGKSAA